MCLSLCVNYIDDQMGQAVVVVVVAHVVPIRLILLIQTGKIFCAPTTYLVRMLTGIRTRHSMIYTLRKEDTYFLDVGEKHLPDVSR